MRTHSASVPLAFVAIGTITVGCADAPLTGTRGARGDATYPVAVVDAATGTWAVSAPP